MAMIAAGHLDDRLPAGEGSGQSDGTHHRLGPAADQPDLLDGSEGRDDSLTQFRLGHRGRPERGALVDGLVDRFDHSRMGMAQDHRAPRTDVIDVFVAIDVENVRSARVVDEHRIEIDAAECPDRRVDTARQHTAGLDECGL